MNRSAVFPLLAAMMFLQFFVWGAWYVTTGSYINAVWGVEAGAGVIGNVYTMGPIAAVIAPLFLGMVADRFFATQKVLGVLHLIGGLALFAAPSVAGADEGAATWFTSVILLHMLCYMPTLGLTSTLAFHHIEDQEKQFPIVRVFGTIGWIVANLAVGEYRDAALPFYVAGGCGLAMGLFSFFLPHTPPPMAGKKARLGELFGIDALALLKRPSFAVFLFASFLVCIPLAGYYSFAAVYIQAKDFAAANMTIGQGTEVLFLFLMPLFFARLGVKRMLAVGMAAWVLRYLLFSFGADEGVVWMIYGGIALHGICYDFFFVTGQIYVDRSAPPEIRGQSQGLLVLVTQGIGLGIGAQVFGALVAQYTEGTGDAAVIDWTQVWIWPAYAAAAILLLFLIGFRERSSSNREVTA